MSSTKVDRPLDRGFFARMPELVARDLIGVVVRRGPVALRITETEAYAQHDSACHAFKGKTPRTAPLFGPPGHAYVYLCYGIHKMLNMTAAEDGFAAGVLIRSAEVVDGVDVVCARRESKPGSQLCAGPGKIGVALDLSTEHSGKDLIAGDFLLLTRTPVARVLTGTRIGIDYALPADRALPWRFADGDSAAVTKKKELR